MPAPDVNTNEQVMAWVMDTYSMHVGRTETAIVTGKPVILGGSEGRREATGRGVMICTREAAAHLKLDLAHATVAVQGFGNVGSVSADLLHDLGSNIVAVTDWVRAVPDCIARFVPHPYVVLGTDGYGFSDIRPALRRHFEVDAEHVALAALTALSARGEIDPAVAAKAVKELGLNPDAPPPWTV